MGSIVIELQKDSLNSSLQISDLLRKALFVAKKLEIKEFETWISNELGGYKKVENIPDYRIVTGQVKAWNQFHGWVPVLFEDPIHARSASESDVGQSISALEELLQGDSGLLAIPFPPEIVHEIARATGNRPTEIVLQVQRSGIRSILDTVRTIVLNWSLQLEKDEIVGEGLTFSNEEKNSASRSTYNVNNFFGPVEHSKFQQDVNKGIQSELISDFNYGKLLDFLETFSKSIPDLNLQQDIFEETKSDIQSVKSQLNSPRPKKSIIQNGLLSLKRILENVTSKIGAELLLKLTEFL